GLLTVSTDLASALGGGSATLNATVNPGGAATTAFFQYGTTVGYGSTTPAQNIGAAMTALPVSAPVTGLVAGTAYHYRIVAFNPASGTNFGGDVVFTTLSMP